MSVNDRDRIDSLFRRARGLPFDEHAAFLSRECAGEPELRAEVARLLAGENETETLAPPRGSRALSRNDLLAGRFSILRLLGSGGMGEVYEAADRQLGGTVALKVLRPELAHDARFLERFRREVQTARQVTHRNICRIFDVGFHSANGKELTFLTMEFLDGVTLSQRLRTREGMPVADALPLIRQIADGLDALHQKGIIHRDFKPGNIMLVPGPDGTIRAVIADFGLARAIDVEPDSALAPTLTGQIVGTPDYMAPEQLLGRDLTPAADIYALGLVIYEMVTGRKPFPASAGGAFARAIERAGAAPVPPSRYANHLPKSWERTLLQCLEREPHDRPQSAGEVVEGLSGGRISGKRRRPRWLTGVLTSLAVLVLAAAGAWRFELVRRVPAPPARQHVAVLSFNVLGKDPELAVFADGLMEGITGRLSQFEAPNQGLTVVPAGLVRQQGAKTPADAKTKLGADEVVQGSLQTQGERVRLLLTLVNTGEASQTRSLIVEDKRANALSLEDAAVEKLAAALNLRAAPETGKEALAAVAPGAYEYYLQARGYLQRRDRLPGIESAILLFQRGLEIDSQSAGAYAGLGEAYKVKFDLTRDSSWLDKALTSCKRALELNPSLPGAYIVLGRIHLENGRYDEAQKDFEKALTFDSRDSQGYQGLAQAYEGLKRYDQAEATYRKAIALRPEDWNGYRQFGLYYYRRRDFDRAIEQYRQVVALTPDNAQGYTNLGAFQILKGATLDAQKSLARALQLDPDRVSTIANLAKLYFDQGLYPKAIELYQRAAKLNAGDFRMPGSLGIAYKRSGDDAHARAPLESAIRLVDGELRVNPKRAELYSYQGLYLAALGRSGEANAASQRALELAPDDTDILVRTAETQASMGNNEHALALLRKLGVKGYPLTKLKNSAPLRPLLTKVGVP